MQPLPTPVRVPLDLEHEREHEGGGVRGEEQDQKILDQEAQPEGGVHGVVHNEEEHPPG